MITLSNLPEFSESILFMEYAWHSLTEQQKVRICLKYELSIKLDEIEPEEVKRDIYRFISDKYGNVTMRTVENIANKLE